MITKKQKQYLKGLANPLSPGVIIGKEGLTDNIIESIDEYLTSHELLKVSVLKSCKQPKEEIILDVQSHTHCELISSLGHRFVVYRRNHKQPVIELPR